MRSVRSGDYRVTTLDRSAMSAWFEQDVDVTIAVDGDIAPFYLDEVAQTRWGWRVVASYRPLVAPQTTDWLDRVAMSSNAILTTGVFVFPLVDPDDPQARENWRQFASLCAEMRFGRMPIPWNEVAPLPQGAERAALYETTAVRLAPHVPTIEPATVT